MNTSKELQTEIEKWIVEESRIIYDRLYEGSRQKTPVKTGRARDGWRKTIPINKVGDTGEIINEVPYIGWLEFGTTRMYPRHMVTETILEIKKDYR